jgi:hypothetical protein
MPGFPATVPMAWMAMQALPMAWRVAMGETPALPDREEWAGLDTRLVRLDRKVWL